MKEPEFSLPEPARNWALFLDVDGTLLDIAPSPDAVIVPVYLRGLLRDLEHLLGGAVALVSGRTIADLDRIFAPLTLASAGQHGAELRFSDGADARLSLPPLGERLLSNILAFAAERPGIVVESKGQTVAVHYRLAPDRAAELDGFLDVQAVEQKDAIDILHGKWVFEVKPRGISKGTAIGRFMRHAPFAGRRPVFIGDDTTDEDGFAAVRDLHGHAIRVGLHGESLAGSRIETPEDTRAWLMEARRKLAVLTTQDNLAAKDNHAAKDDHAKP
jgi:trehalose 6-phosphate phosphatase